MLGSATLGDVAIGKWRGVSYSCPFCFAILSVAIDPVALKADIVAEMEKSLKPLRSELSNVSYQLEQLVLQLRR